MYFFQCKFKAEFLFKMMLVRKKGDNGKKTFSSESIIFSARDGDKTYWKESFGRFINHNENENEKRI